MLTSTVEESRNLLIRQLSAADRSRLARHFVAVPLSFKQSIYDDGDTLEYVHFPESGVISLVTALEGSEPIEAGTVGHEGIAGLSVVLGAERAAGRAMCQIPGMALRLPAAIIAAERDAASAWFRVLLRYVHFSIAMIAQTAACNRAHQVDARMSRWLLMTHDRVDGDQFPLTQEFLAQMLGVTRPTVNIAGAILQKAGFIQYRRGQITIVNRAGLESAACECYGRIREKMEQMLSARPRENPSERRSRAAAPERSRSQPARKRRSSKPGLSRARGT
jgi:CRP-like cAMP-binding protein